MDACTAERLVQELRTLRGLEAWLRNPVLLTAQPNSDLSVDLARLPDIWATTVVHRSLTHTVECLSVAGALIPGDAWIHAPFVLLRGAYESAAVAVWLLEPDSAEDRLTRLIAQHGDSWRYSAKAYSGTPLEDGGLHGELPPPTRPCPTFAYRADWPHSHNRPAPGARALLCRS